MKKLFKFSLLLMLVCVGFASCVDDNEISVPIEYSDLPNKAQSFISQHFGASAFRSMTEIEDTLGVTGYEVELADNVQVEFDKDGVWQIIEGNGKMLPGTILLQYVPDIPMYVEDNYPDEGITRYDRTFYGMRVALENGTALSFLLTGEMLGNSKAREDLPQPAQELIANNFDPLDLDVEFFEAGEGEDIVYTAQYINGYQAQFDMSGNWLSLRGDSATHILPAGIKSFLPGKAIETLTDFSKGDITSIKRVSASSTINVTQVYRLYLDETQFLLVTIASAFTSEGDWLALEDINSGLPKEVSGLLPQAAQDLLEANMPNRLEGFTSIKQNRNVRLGLEYIDIVELGYSDASLIQFIKNDGAPNDGQWYRFRGTLPATIIDLLQPKTKDFLTTYLNGKINSTQQKIVEMDKEVRWEIPLNTKDSTAIIRTRVVFQDNSYIHFNDAQEGEWENIVLNNMTPAEWAGITAGVLPTAASMYVHNSFGDSAINYISKQRIISTITDTLPEPDIQVPIPNGTYESIGVIYAPDSYGRRNDMRFDTNGNMRTITAVNNTAILPSFSIGMLSDRLKDYIAAKNMDINTLSHVNQITDPERVYSLAFLYSADSTTFVTYDLDRDVSVPDSVAIVW